MRDEKKKKKSSDTKEVGRGRRIELVERAGPSRRRDELVDVDDKSLEGVAEPIGKTQVNLLLDQLYVSLINHAEA